MQEVAGYLREFGLGIVVVLILFRWVCPKLDRLADTIEALTLILANHFNVTPDELAAAKAKLRGKKSE